MNTEEKAKAYDEALKRAKAAFDVAADKDLVGGVVRTIFPELKESEDEKIRQGMIRFLESEQAEGIFTHEARQSWIAYLEKQKEQKPAEWSEEDRSFYDSILCEVIKEGMHPTPEQAKWFKSLPKRFNLQPKQEWSEEDKKK